MINLLTLIVKSHLGNTGDDKQGVDEVSLRKKGRNSSTKRNLTLFMTNSLNIHPKIFLSFLIGWNNQLPLSSIWKMCDIFTNDINWKENWQKKEQQTKMLLQRGQHWRLYFSRFGRDGVHCLPCFSLEDYFLISKVKTFAFWHLSWTFLEKWKKRGIKHCV